MRVCISLRRWVGVAGLLVLLVLSGCSYYQPYDGRTGFSETQLSKNLYRVRYKGNSIDDAATVNQMVMLRSADLTLREGFSDFLIVDKRVYRLYTSSTTPGYTTRKKVITKKGNVTTEEFIDEVTPARTTTNYFNNIDYTILMYTGKAPLDTDSFNAQETHDRYHSKYQ